MIFDSSLLNWALACVVVLFVIKKYAAGGHCHVEKNVQGQIAVVTGGNSGIGKETVRRLSQLGCKIIVGARDTKKNQDLVKELQQYKGKVVAYTLDLSDRSSIQNFAQNVKKQLGAKPLNYLVNNAGVMALPQKKLTKQGHQMQFGVNHFGHFYLTYLLWDNLKKCNNFRVINVSSKAHRDRGPAYDIDFNDINYERSTYIPWAAYSHSKKANILFTKELQRRINQNKINGFTACLHPGVVRTELARDMLNAGWKRALMTLAIPIQYILLKTSEQGAQTTLELLLQRQEKLKAGQYYADCAPSPLLAKQCESLQAAAKLWQVSQAAWGIKFNV